MQRNPFQRLKAGGQISARQFNEAMDSIEEVRRILLRAVELKPTGHDLDKGVSTERRSMFQIGG